MKYVKKKKHKTKKKQISGHHVSKHAYMHRTYPSFDPVIPNRTQYESKHNVMCRITHPFSLMFGPVKQYVSKPKALCRTTL